MIDIEILKENPQKVERAALSKGVKIDVGKILALDKERKQLLFKIETLRSSQKKLNFPKKEKDFQVAGANRKAKEIKEEIKNLEPKLKKTEKKLKELLFKIPNLPAKDVKVGKDESDNEVIKKTKKLPSFGFPAKSYDYLGTVLDIIDTKRASKVSGSRFGYLKNEGAILELALIKFAFDFLTEKGFSPVIPPTMLKNEVMAGLGYLEQGGEEEMYFLEKDQFFLAATSEHPLVAMHKDEVLKENEFPLRYVGFSSCFRREAGSYGKDVKGIFRVHQFDKVEMVSFVKPEDGNKEHQFLLSLEEKITSALGLPYQVVKMCTGDLGFPVARKFDIEVFFPFEGRFRETHSTSTCTDFQSRRLNIRYKERKTNKNLFVYTLNGTAIAIGRTILAILENYQQKDNSVFVPKILQKYTGFSKIIPKKST